MEKTVCIIQARMDSTRLQGKVLLKIMGYPMLWHIVQRIKKAEEIHQIIIATTNLERDKQIIQFAQQNKIIWYAGSSEDVLDRYKRASQLVDAEIIVRVTSDCPLIDPVTLDRAVKYYKNNDYDYVRLDVDNMFSRGLDVEVFSKRLLFDTAEKAVDKASREHVTYYMYNYSKDVKVGRLPAPIEYIHPNWRFCVDEEKDFKLIEEIYSQLYVEGKIIDILEVFKLLNLRADLQCINSTVVQKKP